VTLCGRVSTGDGKPSAFAKVTVYNLTNIKPEKTTAPKPKELENMNALKTAVTRPDGLFFFLNLKEGNYILKARAAHGPEFGQNRAAVSRDKQGVIQMVVSDIELSRK